MRRDLSCLAFDGEIFEKDKIIHQFGICALRSVEFDHIIEEKTDVKKKSEWRVLCFERSLHRPTDISFMHQNWASLRRCAQSIEKPDATEEGLSIIPVRSFAFDA